VGTNGVDPGRLMAEGRAAVADGNYDAAIAHLSAAVRGFSAEGDNRGAAMACANLGDVCATRMGNKVAAHAWFSRAIRLVADEEPCVEQGWVAVAAMGCEVDDVALLMERTALALDRARRFGDVNLETKALADGGLAYVQAGHVAQGMAMIDEAMALVCGGGAEPIDSIGKAVCSFFTACYFAADFARAEAWAPALRQHGFIGTASIPQTFLGGHCDSVKGALLCQLGRWNEAEEVLLRAHESAEKLMPGISWHPVIALADLRILQGRLAEAEALLLGRDDRMHALLPTARLHLARGDYDLAGATARRGLRLIGDDRLRAPELLGVLIEAHLGRGAVDDAAAALADLDQRIAGLGMPALMAEAALLRSRVDAAAGDNAAAIAAAGGGLRALGDADLPRVRARLHLQLARLHDAAADHETARLEATAAAAVLARVDVVVPAEDEALLRRLVGGHTPPAAREPRCRVATLERDGGWWTAGCADTKVRLRDTKGMRYLADVVGHAGSERHVVDLVDRVEGVAPADTGLDRRRLGDAGPVADRYTREAYRRRVAELRDEVEDALAMEDDERAAKLQGDLDQLIAELARAFGLGGRERHTSSVAEKARLNVTRALRAAIGKVTEALPDAGAVLDRRVRTGLFCAYEPHADDEILWSVQS
jgi:tetratricopeptide (TPR) repeat protein